MRLTRRLTARRRPSSDPLPAYSIDNPPQIVTPCGSMRFADLMIPVASWLSITGTIVLAPFVTLNGPGTDPDPDRDPVGTRRVKDNLDAAHLVKISMSDRVVVVSDDTGYYGDSTKRAIAYAHKLTIPVTLHCVNTGAVPYNGCGTWFPLLPDDNQEQE